jgi:Holliday junction resolvasome RuvABC DNA-binding subunit
MITFLEGIVEDKQPTHVVINVGGVRGCHSAEQL